MADVRIGYEDLFKEDVFKLASKQAEEFISVLNKLQKKVEDLAKTINEQAQALKVTSPKEFKELLSNLQKVNKLQKQNEKIEKQKTKLKTIQDKLNEQIAKIQEKINSLSSEEAAKLEEARQQLRDIQISLRQRVKTERAIKELQEEGIKINEEQIGAYGKLTSRLNKLKTIYKDLVAAGEEQNENAKNILNEIQKLDKQIKDIDASVGDFFRNVGNYQNSLKGLFEDLKGEVKNIGEQLLGELSSVGKGVNVLVNAFKDIKKQGIKSFKDLGRASKTLLVSSLLSVATVLSGLLDSFKQTKAGATVFNFISLAAKSLVLILVDLGDTLFKIGQKIAKFFTVFSQNVFSVEQFKKALREAGEVGVGAGANMERIWRRLVSLFTEGWETARRMAVLELEVLKIRRQQVLEAQKLSKIEAYMESIFEDFNVLENLKERIRLLQNMREQVEKITQKQLEELEVRKQAAIAESRVLEPQLAQAKTAKERAQIEAQLLELQQKLTELDIERIQIEEEGYSKIASLNAQIVSQVKDYVDALQELENTFTDLDSRILELRAEVEKTKIDEVVAKWMSESLQFRQELEEVINRFSNLFELSIGEDKIDDILQKFETIASLEHGEFIKFLERELGRGNLNKEAAELLKRYKEIFELNTKIFNQDVLNTIEDLTRTITESLLELNKELLDAGFGIESVNEGFKNFVRLLELDLNRKIMNQIDNIRQLQNEVIKTIGRLSEFDRGQFDEQIGALRLLSNELDKLNSEVIETIVRQKEFENSLNQVFSNIRDSASDQIKLLELETRVQEQRVRIAGKSEEELTKIKREFAIKRATIEAQSIQKQIDALKELSEVYKIDVSNELKELQLKLESVNNEMLLAVSNLEGETQTLKERFSELGDVLLEVTEIIIERIRKINQQRLKELENNLGFIDRRIGLLEEQARQGGLNAEKSIIALEEQRRQLEMERSRLVERQQRQELLLAALRTYTESLKQTQSPAAAFVETVKNVQLIRSFIESLPVFHKGTEFVTANGAKNEIIAKLEVGERVISKEDNKKIGGITNKELVKRIQEGIYFDYDSFRESLLILKKDKNRIIKTYRV